VSWAAIAAIVVVIPMQFGRGAVLPVTDPTDEVTVVVEEYVAEQGSASEVVAVEVVVASSIAAPLVDPIARRLAEYLSSPVQLQLLVVSTETERATVDP
jgi:hypothetical protein